MSAASTTALPLPGENDLTHVSFKDTNFLQMFGLWEHNVLDYFALSQFYDKSSLNEQIKMQARFNELQANMLDRRRMVGLEYDLWYFTYQPSLFVIRKKYRSSPTKVDLIGIYYIIEGTIYQAPDLYTLLSNRILTSLHFVEKAFVEAREEARFHPAQGYLWAVDEEEAAKARAAASTTTTTTSKESSSSSSQSQSNSQRKKKQHQDDADGADVIMAEKDDDESDDDEESSDEEEQQAAEHKQQEEDEPPHDTDDINNKLTVAASIEQAREAAEFSMRIDWLIASSAEFASVADHNHH
ncbi:Mediator of RNA polymerase II transcription subunit 6, partial [Quaeritorhiza haematococci]